MRDAEHIVDALDREIAEVLAVDPSPQFDARVRQRVAHERHSPAWPLVSLKVAAVVVVGFSSVVIWQSRREPAPLRGRLIVAAIVRPAELAPPTVPTARPPEPASPVAVPLEPEILVDAREARATRALIAGVVDGRIGLSPLLDASASPFLEVVPIPRSDFDTGVPQ